MLTAQLVKHAGKVIAVEVDEGLCEHLRRRFEGVDEPLPRLRATSSPCSPEDLLRESRAGPPYVVVGNLPYNIAAAVLRLFLEAKPQPQRHDRHAPEGSRRKHRRRGPGA